MTYSKAYAIAFFVSLIFLAQPVASDTPAANAETQFLVTRQKADPRFIIAMTRLGPCTIAGPPKPIRIPYQLYPPESLRLREQGRVVMQASFDVDSCVSKVSLLQSSGYWRLDEVSLRFAMTMKTEMRSEEIVDGHPTFTFPITWKLPR
jgi:TonB family protein